MEKSLQILSEKTLSEHEQATGAPIVIQSLRVAYDYTYNREVLFIRGTNQSGGTVRSLYFDLACMDDAGDSLGITNGACIRALEAAPGTAFGEDSPVVIPFSGTCRVELTLKKVVFADGSVWREGDAPINSPAATETAEASESEATVPTSDSAPEAIPADVNIAPESSPADESITPEAASANETATPPSAVEIPAQWLNPPATVEGYRAAAEGLTALGDPGKSYLIKKFTALADKLEADAAEAARKEAEAVAAAKQDSAYKALAARTPNTAEEWEALAADWKTLANYKDAPKRAAEALKKAKSIRTSQKRLAQKRAEEERLAALAAAQKRKRVMKTALWIGSAILLVTAICVLTFAVIIPASRQERYNNAEALLAEGKYTEAINTFEELDDYKDSKDRAKDLRIQLTGRENSIFLTSADYPCFSVENGVLSYNSAQYRLSGKQLRIPDYLDDQKITAISASCFTGLTAVEAVELPPSVTVVGNSAFADCTALTSFTAPNLTTIGAETFRGCTALTEINIPEKVTSIGANAFQGCTALKKVHLPDGVRKLSDSLFLNCTALTEVTFSDRITSIGAETFAYCTSLPSLTLPETLESIGNNAFLSCNSFTALQIPDSVTSMGDKAMANCASLTEVHLGAGLQKIAARTFEGSKALKTLYLPSTLTQIGYAAFAGCEGLTDVHFSGTAEDFAKIEILADNTSLTSAKLHSNS